MSPPFSPTTGSIVPLSTPEKTARIPLAPTPVRSTSQLSLTSVPASTSTPSRPPIANISEPTSPLYPRTNTLTNAGHPASGFGTPNTLLSPSPRRRTISHSASSNTLSRSSRASSLYDGRAGPGRGGSFTPRSPSPAAPSVSLSLAAAESGSSRLDGAGGGARDGGETPLSDDSNQTRSSRTQTSRKGKERAVDRIGAGARAGLQTEEMEDGEEVLGEVVEPSVGRAAEGLRELVRRATVGEKERPIRSRASSIKGELHTLDPPSKALDSRAYEKRKYYVLTNAGKPVFSSDDASEDNLTNLMGVAQALISIFAEDDDRLRCISRGRHRIAFILKSPLYFFAISDWGEPEHVLRGHLEYIYLQIISVVSSTQLSRAFQRRSNFDLSRLIEGTEPFLHHLIDSCQYDFSYLTSTLQPLRMPPALRDVAAGALMPPAKFKDLLYVLLVAGGHIVTLLRPRKHSIHPSDLHLLLNTLASSAALRSTETWLPICLPKFNDGGFVHAYVSYVLEDVGLVFVSADRDAFEELRGWKETVVAKLEADKNLDKIQVAISQHPYSATVIGQPGIRHFMYKSRQNVQITMPCWAAPYDQPGADRNRLVTAYQQLHDAIHARSGQSTGFKLVYMRTDREACLAWITRPFEMYLAVDPDMPKSTVVGAANAIARWVQAEETKLFLKDAPVF